MADKRNKNIPANNKGGQRNTSPATPAASATTDPKISATTKKVIALVAGIILLYIAKVNNDEFLTGRIENYWNDYKEQRTELDPETRLQMRHGGYYAYTKHVAELAKRANIGSEDLILMPTTAYLAASGIDYRVPEPSVIYYFTGLKTLANYNSMAVMPKWYCRYANRAFYLDRIESKQQLDSILAILKPYPDPR